MSKAEGEEPEQAAVGVDLDETTRNGLTDTKQLAIDLIVIGTKRQDVADGVGISRQQLWRWRQERSFVVALQQRRAELHQGLADQFWGGLVREAIRVAAESLAEGDPEMARDILRLAARGLTDLKAPDAEPPSEEDQS